jgi:hypothetical protein
VFAFSQGSHGVRFSTVTSLSLSPESVTPTAGVEFLPSEGVMWQSLRRFMGLKALCWLGALPDF